MRSLHECDITYGVSALSYLLLIKPAFHEELASLSRNLQEKVTKALEQLEKNPEKPRGDTIKKLSGHKNTWRYRVNDDHRLIYAVSGMFVQLLAIRPRGIAYAKEWGDSDDLKEFNVQDADYSLTSQPVYPESSFAYPVVKEQPLPELTAATLKNLGIAAQYQQAFLQCKTEDALLELQDVPREDLERLLEFLYPKSAVEILAQPDLLLSNPADLIRYAEGDLVGFLLKLDAEQEKVVDWALEGPTLLKGGPGTGKSTVALYRVANLFGRHAGTPSILFTTYTKALTEASKQLLGQIFQGEVPAEIEVSNLDELANKIVRSAGEVSIIFPSGSENRKAVEQARQQLNLSSKSSFEKAHLQSALANLSTTYLVEEFEKIIEGQECGKVEDYIGADRTGREYPFNESLRRAVWELYMAYLNVLTRAGKTTYGGVRIKALQAVRSGEWRHKYDYVLIDEAQDFPPSAIALCVELCKTPKGIFLTADTAQSIYNRGFSWKSAHDQLRVTGRTRVFNTNYRSTEQIGLAARELIDPSVGDSETVDQQYKLQGELPGIGGFKSKEAQIAWIFEQLKDATRTLHFPLGSAAILVPTNDLGQLIDSIARHENFPARFMKSDAVDLQSNEVKVLTMHTAKGLDFPIVAVAFLEEGILPKNVPGDDLEAAVEHVNAARRLLYVACTRAARHLIVTYSDRNPSRLVEYFSKERWAWERSY